MRLRIIPVCAALFLVVISMGCRTTQPAETVLPEEELPYQAISYFVELGRPEDAIKAFEEASARAPEDPETRLLYVNLLLMAGKETEAEAELSRLLEEYPDHVGALYTLALLEGARGREEEHRRLLERVLALDPHHTGARAALGELLLSKKQYARAEKEFTTVLEEDPGDLVALVGLGNVYLRTRKAEKAAEVLTQAIRQAPDYPFAYADRARAWQMLDEPEKAEQDISRAIELDPGFSWHYYDRARILISEGQMDRALEDLSRAILLDPSNFLAYVYRARIYDGKEMMKEACSDYARALELRPDYYYIYVPYAVTLYHEKDYRGAAVYFDKGFDAYPSEYPLILLAATAYKRAGDDRMMRDYLTRRMPQIPRDSIYYFVARYYLEGKGDSLVLTRLRDIADKVERTRVYFFLGIMAEEEGHPRLAQTYFTEVADNPSLRAIEGRMASWEMEKYR
ncbi:Tetratricopeptide TPR_1 repeat-containing protein [Spirochaeta thermophila DSM 6578]|uniref:Tetratricopeptide TPR_1 repeat-containing protein n=1 Tax=Winmispira thermophila (strain ATCC 700085 / DSM 6578 / Z-1203) TaxID=869211 RepID=G0GC48_WINT7|nr:tetratricopeptide repeat protein [Spirochaeta thermophila]AEJ60412.1 Tetratricopeptide TPR_1 repeat-containing protein [Spirochaeta thermophila DSM 6578]